MDKKYINPKTGRKYEYYDREGKGIGEVLEWAKLFESKIVKQENTWMGFLVSTVWLGLDHAYGEGEDPLIFETMVFFRGRSDLEMDRYTTEEQAREGHREMVRKWSNPFYVLYKILEDKTWSLRWNIRKLLKLK